MAPREAHALYCLNLRPSQMIVSRGFLPFRQRHYHHDAIGTGCQGLDHISRIPYAAIADDPHFFLSGAFAASMTAAVISGTPVPATIRVVHMDPGPIPTLRHRHPHRRVRWPFGGTHIAGYDPVLEVCLIFLSASMTPRVWPYGRCRGKQHPPLLVEEHMNAVHDIRGMPTRLQRSGVRIVSCGIGMLLSLDVAEVIRPMSLPCLLTTGSFSILFFKIQFRFFRSSAFGSGDKVFAGHQRTDPKLHIRFQPEVAVGKYANQFFAHLQWVCLRSYFLFIVG